MTIARSLYVKNVPNSERIARIVLALATAAAGMMWLSSPWSWIATISALALSATGLIGFCPMCAMVGRRLG